jgi:uncharacterized phage protein (TIGR01671 family)
MSEIKYRAKIIKTGEWAYGYYLYFEKCPALIYFPSGVNVVVNPLTVGQYTGLKDKNGKEIYEGDVLQATSTGGNIAVVDQENGCWNANFEKGSGNVKYPLALRTRMDEVIGNIWDDPELLDVKG